MAGIRIFKLALSDRFSGEPMTLEGWRSFDAADCPFSLDEPGIASWPMTVGEASRLGGSAQRLDWRIQRAAERGERPEAGSFFRRKLSSDGASALIELGLATIEKIDAIFFEFGAKRATLSDAHGANLLAAFSRFSESVVDLHRSQPGGGVQQLAIRPDWGFEREDWYR